MADGIYISMCGAVARGEQLDAIADNLANAQTPGFKASRPAFETFMAPSGAQDKQYAAAVATAFNLRPGPTAATGNPLDVVPDEGAFLVVQQPGGELAYTRDGRLTLDGSRRLVSGAGKPVLDAVGRPSWSRRTSPPPWTTGAGSTPAPSSSGSSPWSGWRVRWTGWAPP